MSGESVAELLAKRRTPLPRAGGDQLKHNRLLDRLAGLSGMAWAYAVLLYTGLSASAASKKFTPRDHTPINKDGKVVVNNVMYQYLRGARAPTRGPRGKLGFDLVGAVDADPKGHLATHWLTHPLFAIFHPDLSLEGIRDIEAKMSSEIVEVLFGAVELDDPHYLRRPHFEKELTAFLRRGTFDAFLGVCLLFRECQLIGDAYHAEQCLWFIDIAMKPAREQEYVLNLIAKPFLSMLHQFFDWEDNRARHELSNEELAHAGTIWTFPRVSHLNIDWAEIERDFNADTYTLLVRSRNWCDQ